MSVRILLCQAFLVATCGAQTGYVEVFVGQFNAPRVHFSATGDQVIVCNTQAKSEVLHVDSRAELTNIQWLPEPSLFSGEDIISKSIVEKNERYLRPSGEIVFIDSLERPVLPLNPNFGGMRPYYPPKEKPIGLYAATATGKTLLTIEPDDVVRAFFFDDISGRCLIETNGSSTIHWVDVDLGKPHLLPSMQAGEVLGDYGSLRYWLIPGEDVLMLPLPRLINEQLLEFRLAFCGFDGKMLGVLPMRPDIGSYQEGVAVFASANLLVISLETGELCVYRKISASDGGDTNSVIRLKQRPDLDEQMRFPAKAYFESLVRSGLVNPNQVPPDAKITVALDEITTPSVPQGLTGIEVAAMPDSPNLAHTLFIGATEVTNAAFAYVLNWAISHGKLANVDKKGGELYEKSVGPIEPMGQLVIRDGKFAVISRDGHSMNTFPVLTNLSSAMAFCNWLSEIEGLQPCYDLQSWSLTEPFSGGYRLPTQEEWLWAATGGRPLKDAIPWLSDSTQRTSHANCDRINAFKLSTAPYLSPVGYYNSNSGDERPDLVDMIGNASEMVHPCSLGPESPPHFDAKDCAVLAVGGDWCSCESEAFESMSAWAGFRVLRRGDLR